MNEYDIYTKYILKAFDRLFPKGGCDNPYDDLYDDYIKNPQKQVKTISKQESEQEVFERPKRRFFF